MKKIKQFFASIPKDSILHFLGGTPFSSELGITIDIQFKGAFASDAFTAKKVQVLDLNNTLTP